MSRLPARVAVAPVLLAATHPSANEAIMLEYLTDILRQSASGFIGLPIALALGVASAAASTCCTLPAMGVLIGYSVGREDGSRKAALKTTAFFVLGTVVSLMVVGGIAGFAGQVAQGMLGRYWKLFAGVAAILFGLATLKMLPFGLSFGSQGKAMSGFFKYGTVTAGFLIGGVVAVTSLPCNPGIFIVLGAAVLQGHTIWAAALLSMFAIGFSLPLGAVLLGVSLGKTSIFAGKADTVIRWVSGIILLVVGFYLLVSF